MDTLSLVSEYLKNLEECMDDGDSRVAKEMKLLDALEHKSVVIEVGNQKFAIFTMAPLWAFGARDTELDLVDLANYVTEKVLDSMGFVHVSISDYGRKMVNDVNVEIHGVKFKADFVVLDYANEGVWSIFWGKLEAQVKNLSRWGRQTATKDTIELEESKLILESIGDLCVLYTEGNGMNFLIGKERLNKKDFSEEDKVGIIEHNLPKKMCDPGNYVLPVKINGVVEMVALVDTEAIDLLVLDILVDLELPLLLGRPFLRTCGTIIDMGRGTLCIDDGVIRHTYFPKPRSKSYVETFEMEGEDDWLGVLLVPFKNMNCVMKLVDFLGSLLVQLKNIDWGNEGYRTYKKIDGDGIWHASYEGDGDVFVDYSWERALSINDEVYPEWVLEFFSTMYFDKDVDKSNLMKEKCIWFRLCRNEHILTLPKFAVVLGLFMKDEVNHRLFGVHFGELEVDDKQFDHMEYWTKVGKLTLTNHMEVLVNEPLMRKESRGVNLAWIIADHLYKHAPGTKESSVICAGHYVTKIASSLGYCVDDEIKKCSEPIDYWNASLNEVEHGNVRRDSMLIRNNYMLKHSMPILHHLENQGNFAYPTYEPPNVPPYLYPYIPYPHSYTHYPNPGNQSNQGRSYGLGDDEYFTSAVPDFGGNSSGYAVGGSSGGAGFDDEDMDE
ncbi:hypothetical protein Tco_1238768 [Tanacetum coccineum]